MNTQRPFRFAVGAWSEPSPTAWADLARKTEALGYAVFLMPDHFDNALAPAAGLMAAAYVTTTLRIGVTVYAADYRHPAMLAKEAATLDLLSEGRLEFGIGAGWDQPEYERAGIPFSRPGERVDRMFEALEIIKGLWSEGPFSFAGRHYTIAGLDGFPKPIQRPHPPIYIGGGGKRLLQFAAREADIVGVLFKALPGGGLDIADDSPAALDRKIAWVREAAGERFQHIELATLIQNVKVTNDRQAALEQLGVDWGIPVSQLDQSPYFLIGTIEQIAERLLYLRQRYGFSHVTVFQWDMEAFAPVVARLAET